VDLKPRPDCRRPAVEVDDDHEHVENRELYAQAGVWVVVIVDPDHGVHTEPVLNRHHRDKHRCHKNGNEIHTQRVVLCIYFIRSEGIDQRLVDVY